MVKIAIPVIKNQRKNWMLSKNHMYKTTIPNHVGKTGFLEMLFVLDIE